MLLRPIVSLFTVAVFAFPQSAPAPNQNANLEGKVVSALSEPLRKTTLRLQVVSGPVAAAVTAAAPRSSYSVTTDAAGNFHFDSVEPGRYVLVAERNGYLRQFYGARAPGGQGLVFELSAGGHLTGLTVAMMPQGIIYGTVEDEDGEPFGAAQVIVYKVGYQGGKRQFVFAGNAMVNADGTFVVGSRAPGRYYLSASEMGPIITEPGSRFPEAGYITTYYPSAAEQSGAAPIDVGAGAVVRGIEIRLIRARLYQIRGKVAGWTLEAGIANLILAPTDGLPQFRPVIAAVKPDGSFVFSGVAPGSHVVRSNDRGPMNPGQTPPLIAFTRVTITDQDLDDVIVPLGPGIAITGTVTLEAAPSTTPPPPQLPTFVVLQSLDGVFGGNRAQTQNDGSFEIHGLVPTTFRLVVAGLPAGSYVKHVQFAGVDITHDNLDLTAGSSGALELLLSPKTASISGAVRNENGDLLPNVAVTLWTPGQPANGVYDPPRNTNTDATGAFEFGNLAPGEYRIAAWEEIEPGLAGNSDFRARFESAAAKVTVQESSQATADLKVVSRDDILAEIAKLP